MLHSTVCECPHSSRLSWGWTSWVRTRCFTSHPTGIFSYNNNWRNWRSLLGESWNVFKIMRTNKIVLTQFALPLHCSIAEPLRLQWGDFVVGVCIQRYFYCCLSSSRNIIIFISSRSSSSIVITGFISWATLAVAGRAGCPVTKGLVVQIPLPPSLALGSWARHLNRNCSQWAGLRLLVCECVIEWVNERP